MFVFAICTLSNCYLVKCHQGTSSAAHRTHHAEWGMSHAAPLGLPELGPDRLPEGTHWSCWNPTSGETPAASALSVAAHPVDAPACWGGIASLQSLIYRHIFLSYHIVATQSPWDCSHRAHRIASLGPTTYWALKANRKIKWIQNKEHMVLKFKT
jgi:hypothetical protein